MSRASKITAFTLAAGLVGATGYVVWNKNTDHTEQELKSVLTNAEQTTFTPAQYKELAEELKYSGWYRAAREMAKNDHAQASRAYYYYNYQGELDNILKLFTLASADIKIDSSKIVEATDAVLAHPSSDFIAALWNDRNTTIKCTKENIIGDCTASAYEYEGATYKQRKMLADIVLPTLNGFEAPYDLMMYRYSSYAWGVPLPTGISTMDYVKKEWTPDSEITVTSITTQTDDNGLQKTYDFQTDEMIVRDASGHNSDDKRIVVSVNMSNDTLKTQFDLIRQVAANFEQDIKESREHYRAMGQEYWNELAPHLDALIKNTP